MFFMFYCKLPKNVLKIYIKKTRHSRLLVLSPNIRWVATKLDWVINEQKEKKSFCNCIVFGSIFLIYPSKMPISNVC